MRSPSISVPNCGSVPVACTKTNNQIPKMKKREAHKKLENFVNVLEKYTSMDFTDGRQWLKS